MAYIASYISTTSTSELSYWYPEVSEETTANHEQAIIWSYDTVNAHLDGYLATPISKEYTTARYHPQVRDAQGYWGKYWFLRYHVGETDEGTKEAKAAALEAEQWIIQNKAQFEHQYSADEIGIGRAIPNTANTNTIVCISDINANYTNTVEFTYTITITLAGAIGTATFSWVDFEGTTNSETTSKEWIDLEYGLRVLFRANATGTSCTLNDVWTVRCVPHDTQVTGGSMVPIVIRGTRKHD